MKKIIFILLMLLLLPMSVQAATQNNSGDSNSEISSSSNQQVQSLYDYITNMKTHYEILKDMNVQDYVKSFMLTGDGKFSYNKLIGALMQYVLRQVTASIKLMGIIIVISVVCALLNNLQSAFSNESISNIAYFACYAMLIVVVGKSFLIGVDVAKAAINQLTDFMAALIPVLMMLVMGVGGITEATVMDPIVIATINISARIYVNLIIPIILMSFVLQFVNNISEEYKIDKLTKLLNQAALWIQGIIMTIFIGVVTIRGITTKTVDEVAVKTAKYAVDNFVPIVGKCLSDAISTVAGYSILLKNALSGLGLIILLAIVIYPIIQLFIMALLYKLTAAVIEPICDSRLVNCISSAGDSLILITSCLISVSVMFFIMVSIIATAGKMAMG